MGMPNVELLHVIKDPGALIARKRPEPSYPDLPAIDGDQQSSVPGLYLVGEVAGTPLVKLGVNQGHDIVETLAPSLKTDPAPDGAYDLLVVGAGASGFGAMMNAHSKGLRAICIEANYFANTMVNMTRGKVLFAEPLDVPLRGRGVVRGVHQGRAAGAVGRPARRAGPRHPLPREGHRHPASGRRGPARGHHPEGHLPGAQGDPGRGQGRQPAQGRRARRARARRAHQPPPQRSGPVPAEEGADLRRRRRGHGSRAASVRPQPGDPGHHRRRAGVPQEAQQGTRCWPRSKRAASSCT